MANGETSDIKLNWSKIVAWTMTSLFSLLLILLLFAFRVYAEKIDKIEAKVDIVDDKVAGVVLSIAILQTQNSSTAEDISDIKADVKELRK